MGRKLNQGSKWITPVKRLAIYHRDGLCCVYCGSTVEEGAFLTLDHITPCELGGSNEATNLITACRSCNSSKCDRPLKQFLMTLSDKGIDPKSVSKRIRALSASDLTKHLVTAKAIMAARKTSTDEE